MPETTEQASPPLRTWRPMAAWTAGILLALGLVWFVAAVVVPVWQVHSILRDYEGCEVEDKIEHLGGPAQAVPKLTLYLRFPAALASYRYDAAAALGFCGKPAVPALVQSLRSMDRNTRWAAANALGNIGGEAEGAAPWLAKALEDSDPQVRLDAAGALVNIAPETRGIAPVLARSLRDGEPLARRIAADLLLALGPDAREALPSLIAALDDSDAAVRKSAAWYMRNLGADARAVIPKLSMLAEHDADPAVRSTAAKTLKVIQDKSGEK